MANKTWRPIGATGPGVNERATAYESTGYESTAGNPATPDGSAALDGPTAPDGSAAAPGSVSVRAAMDDTIVLVLAGVVDGRMTGQLRAALVAVLLRCRPRRVVLDLRAVTTVDSLGVGTIVAGSQIAEDCDIGVLIETEVPEVVARLRDAGLPAGVLASA